VSGRVQGVFFRMATKQQADLHGLTGWVRNRRDGRVEGVVAGGQQRLDEFIAWLHRGPDLARVLKVELEEVEGEDFDGFVIK
jgi:acylphosphatase